MFCTGLIHLFLAQAERRLRASIDSESGVSLVDSTVSSGGSRSNVSLGTPPISPSRDGGLRGGTAALRAIATPIEEESTVVGTGDQEVPGSGFWARRVPGSAPDP